MAPVVSIAHGVPSVVDEDRQAAADEAAARRAPGGSPSAPRRSEPRSRVGERRPQATPPSAPRGRAPGRSRPSARGTRRRRRRDERAVRSAVRRCSRRSASDRRATHVEVERGHDALAAVAAARAEDGADVAVVEHALQVGERAPRPRRRDSLVARSSRRADARAKPQRSRAPRTPASQPRLVDGPRRGHHAHDVARPQRAGAYDRRTTRHAASGIPRSRPASQRGACTTRGALLSTRHAHRRPRRSSASPRRS